MLRPTARTRGPPETAPGHLGLHCPCGATFGCHQPGCADGCPWRSDCGDEGSYEYTPARDGFALLIAVCPACGVRRQFDRLGEAQNF